MPVESSYPGVYIQEISNTTHTIAGVSTSDAAFVDIFQKGPVNTAIRVSSFGEFTATFGGLVNWSRASYGLYQYFLNGGSIAWVVRVSPAGAKTASVKLDDVSIQAIGPGSWGNALSAAEQLSPAPPGGDAPVDTAGNGVIDLVVRETTTDPSTKRTRVVASEVHRKLSLTAGDPNYIVDALASNSAMVGVVPGDDIEAGTPKVSAPSGASDDITSSSNIDDVDNTAFTWLSGGDPDVTTVSAADLVGTEPDPDATPPVEATGIYPLANISPSVVNIMCLPAMANLDSAGFDEAFANACKFCEDSRAFLVVDTPASWDGDAKATQLSNVKSWFAGLTNRTDHAAVYFPRLTMTDPLTGRPSTTEASGTVAGIYARTDVSLGVWKAPAGTDATLTGANPVFVMSDADNGPLNELGINALRTFPVVGSVVWGARTVRGADALESEWKYVPVRRLALYIEDSLFQGTTWAVFEPNDEALWSSLRESVGAFMADLYQEGAFAGTSAKEAYFVKCDSSTTTATDRANGIVNVLVGFAPLYPAEFVVLQISQIAITSEGD